MNLARWTPEVDDSMVLMALPIVLLASAIFALRIPLAAELLAYATLGALCQSTLIVVVAGRKRHRYLGTLRLR